MRTRAELALALLQHAHTILSSNVQNVTLDEALQSAGGYRSIIGVLKHATGWSHVYHSYAFDAAPRHWAQQDFPRGHRDTIELTQAYLDDVRAWSEQAWEKWRDSLSALDDAAFDEPRPLHWGERRPLFDIAVFEATHCTYHAGEINAILATVRGEAWEYTEEVEENHISTVGHRLRPAWMTPEQAASFEAYLAERDRQLRGLG